MENPMNTNEKKTSAPKEEDAALKVFTLFFASEMIPLCGIHGEVAYACPTELMDIKLSNFYQDFTLAMKDGTWKHFEFESSWLTLTPLMGGKISQKERILDAYELLRDSTAFSQEEKEKLDSVLYVMANKFLNGKELKKVKEEMQMMPLGRMWREDGIAEGRREGLTEGLAAIIKIIRGKMQKGLSCETVAEFLEMDVSYIKKIYNLIQEQPDQTDLQIAQILLMPK